MADNQGNIIADSYQLDKPAMSYGFHIKGASNYDWGMKNRLSRIFRKDGKSVMLAFDHGYIMGPTSGLERLDLCIPPLAAYADCLMGTRGALRAALPAYYTNGIIVRSTAGSSVLRDDMSLEVIGVEMEDAVRLNASCVAIQSFIGSENECNSIKNIVNSIDAGYRCGMPVLGVVAVGKQMERTPAFFKLATRMLAEFGAQIVKTYYCDGFDEVVAACPVPIVIAGGKKLPELEALQMTYNAIQQGASGVDMGRNVFQAEHPVAMLKSINAIVHDNIDAKQAYELYLHEKQPTGGYHEL